MNHGGIEHRSASNSLECALEKRKKAIIRGTDTFSPFLGQLFFQLTLNLYIVFNRYTTFG